MPRTSWAMLRTASVWSPSYPEQRAIAAILDTMDEAIRRTEALIAKLQKVKAGLLHDLLTRGLDEHGQLRDPLRHPEQFKDSELGKIPKEWEVKDLENFVNEADGIKPGPFGSSLTKDNYKNEGFRVYGQEQVLGGSLTIGNYYVNQAKYWELKQFEVREGDILISLVGTIGGTLVVRAPFEPGIINPRLLRLRPRTAEVSVEYLAVVLGSWLTERQLLANSQGGTMPILNGSIMRRITLPKPLIDEQVAISEKLKIIAQRGDTELAYLDQLRLQKQGLMQDLLTGKVRVPESMLDQYETAASEAVTV